ncbi:MAG: AAA family ATPase [Gemmatimonadaceae bacterium]|nr:AAA family ATPase [Gemmatimonadaceae bacterium]
MDAFKNPFAPGAGTPPPELAGRAGIIEAAWVALRRVKDGRSAKSQMLLGLRGVGKTVLLNKLREVAESEGYLTVQLEAPENRRLADMLVPELRKVLLKLSAVERARNLAVRALGTLRSFASTFTMKVGEVEVGVTPDAIGASGNLEIDLPDLLLEIAVAAKAAGRPVVILIDEVQYLKSDDLSALLVAVHKIGQRGLPIVVFGAGLPLLAGLAGDAKSYAERLFDFPGVGPLDRDAAIAAIREPIRHEGADIVSDALVEIVQQTKGYPYFVQEWGSKAWNEAPSSPITRADVERATGAAIKALDGGFFRVRLDRLTPRERDYLRAMATLGPGPHRSGDIAAALDARVSQVGPLRDGLIRKGMIYSPAFGDTAFTVPMFDDYMKRVMPQWKPPTAFADSRKKQGKKR